MNPELQHRFETMVLDKGITSDRRIFDKHKDGVYKNETVFFMYRIWVAQEAIIEVLTERNIKDKEEMFMLGYTEAEYDYWRNK